VTGTGLLKRILVVLAGAMFFLLFATVVRSNATPIRPDLKKVLAPAQDQTDFPLARAGWDGPEAPAAQQSSRNATLEQIGPEASARVARASLKAAALPDYRAVAGILLVILLLRRIRAERKPSRAMRTAGPRPADSPELPRAA
jgi:hypothetical protein